MSLIKYAVRRLLAMVPVIFGVLTLTFIFSRMMPGDPAYMLLVARGVPNPSEAILNNMRHRLGLDLPIILQYFRFLGELFTGHWGESISVARGVEVWDLITSRMPITIDLTIFTIIIAAYIGIKIGVISAVHRNKARDTFFRGIALIGVAIPVFFMGMLLQYIFCIQLDWFPATGYKDAAYYDPDYVTGLYAIDALLAGEIYKIIDYFYHLILPVSVLVFISVASIIRQTRSSMLEVLEQDYIRTARAKGVKEKVVVHKHALKNSLIPTVTILGFSVAGLLTGAILTETTFGLDGMGRLYIESINQYDYWLLMAIVFVVTLILIFTILITDLLYAVLDPRIRY